MNKAITVLLCSVVTSIGLSAREIRIAGQDFPPFNWVNEKKEMVGPMVDRFKAICKELGHACKFEEMGIARSVYFGNVKSKKSPS